MPVPANVTIQPRFVTADETAGVGGEVRLTQTTIAGLLGASRQAVNGVLKDLEREGALEIGYRRVAVIDPVQLADGLS